MLRQPSCHPCQPFACYQQMVQRLACVDGLAPLLIRLYLVPVFWMAGTQKLRAFDDTVAWFGNAEWGLGLPLPWLMAALATAAELAGAVLLLLGLGTRLTAVPLMVTMLVAAFAVHWEFGWQAIADASAPFANARVEAATEKLAAARAILREHGNYGWLTSSGNFVVLNNGIEFAATYFVMLLSLLFTGGGRFVSVDYWLARWLRR
jgi:uncharacterized membrane protein YphA (DoxX/SURF4 family)